MEIFKTTETPGYHLSGGSVMCGVNKIQLAPIGVQRRDRSALFATAGAIAGTAVPVVATDVDVPNGASAAYPELRT